MREKRYSLSPLSVTVNGKNEIEGGGEGTGGKRVVGSVTSVIMEPSTTTWYVSNVAEREMKTRKLLGE